MTGVQTCALPISYAAAIAPGLEVTAPKPKLTKRLAGFRIPLNAWGGVGEASAGTEDYGYAASELLAAGMRSAAANVRINAASLRDRAVADGLVGEVDGLLASAEATLATIRTTFPDRLG